MMCDGKVKGMDAAEAVIVSKLGAVRQELAEKEAAERAYLEEEDRRGAALSDLVEDMPLDLEETLEEREHIDQFFRNREEISTLQVQVRLLEELKASLEQQRTEDQKDFLAIKDRDERSSKQNVRFTIAVSAISLIVGWLLSLVDSPVSVLHVLGH
jgi:hypothetical protein